MEASCELTQLVERDGELVARALERLARLDRIVVELRERQPEGQRERDQALLCAVVEVPLEAPTGDVAGGDDARARRGELLEPRVELVVQTADLRRLCLALGDVRVGDHVPDDPAGSVPDRCRGDRHVDERPILVQAEGFEVVHPLARGDALEELLGLGALRRRCHRQPARAEHLLGRPAEDALRRRVPEPHPRVRAELDERDGRGVDDRPQAVLLLFPRSGVHVHYHVPRRV